MVGDDSACFGACLEALGMMLAAIGKLKHLCLTKRYGAFTWSPHHDELQERKSNRGVKLGRRERKGNEMFCKECGNELVGTELYCDACGQPVQAVRSKDEVVASHRHSMPSKESDAVSYRSFEYARTTVKTDLAQVACDCYESLGFELTGQRASTPGGQVTLSFRRSRKVRGKAQLAKMQRAMDDMLASIADLEAEKTKKATTQALSLGTVSALILGVGMCCTMVWDNLMVPGIAVGIVGIAGCVFTWLRYRKVCEAEVARLNPQIEEAYDRLATQCEEAQAVLRSVG